MSLYPFNVVSSPLNVYTPSINLCMPYIYNFVMDIRGNWWLLWFDTSGVEQSMSLGNILVNLER